jgi:hypothetical protein
MDDVEVGGITYDTPGKAVLFTQFKYHTLDPLALKHETNCDAVGYADRPVLFGRRRATPDPPVPCSRSEL